MTDGARVDVDEYEKDSARDFALWKAPSRGSLVGHGIGPGRPGWHLECSVMAMAAWARRWIWHAGGEDLMFPHHENEIAQSEALTGKNFRALLDACAVFAGRGREDGEECGQLLYATGFDPERIQAVFHPLFAHVGSLSQSAQLYVGWVATGCSLGGKVAKLSPAAHRGELPGGRGCRVAEVGRGHIRADAGRARRRPEYRAGAGAIFEMVRAANVAMDGGQMRKTNALPFLTVLGQFDEIFAVLHDDDAAKMRGILEWAKASDARTSRGGSGGCGLLGTFGRVVAAYRENGAGAQGQGLSALRQTARGTRRRRHRRRDHQRRHTLERK